MTGHNSDFEFKKFLLELSRELDATNVRDLKFLCLRGRVAEQCEDGLDVFGELQKLGDVRSDNLEYLKTLMKAINRRDLSDSIDKYSQSQATHLPGARSVRSQSLEEPGCRSGEFSPGSEVDAFRSLTCAVVRGSNVCLERNNQQTDRSHSSEERRRGCGEFTAGCEGDALRSLSCTNNDTTVKTCNTTSNNTRCQRYTQPTDSCRVGRVVDAVEQSNAPASVTYLPVINNQSSSCTTSKVEYCTEDTDGPEADASSPKPSRPVAVLSPTSACSATDSGYVEQDGRLSPNVIPSMKSTRAASGGTTPSHRRPVENHSSVVTLRNYQIELAEPGCQGSNCIICAPTGSGKTFTAGYICKTRRDRAIAQQQRFKCLFVVCIRNLISQQRDALCCIMPETGVVFGIDDRLTLSECFQQFDVVVATAQLFLNALKTNEMKISDIDMLIMDECHHTILSHPYNAIMEAYYTTCRQHSGVCLPQIIGLTASLGVGACEDDPRVHYVRICANLDCECITYVRREENVRELLEFNPRPQRDQIIAVEPRSMDTEFAIEVTTLMKQLMVLDEMRVAVGRVSPDFGTQQFENWVVQIRLDADKRDAGFISATAAALQRMNAALLVYKELRLCDSFDILEEYFRDDQTGIHDTIFNLYDSRRATLERLAAAEPVSGDNPKLHKLCDLLIDLFSSDFDPRGILLTRTRLAVGKLVDYVHEQPQLQGRVFAEKLVGQGQRDGTMTDIQQENTLRRFRADRDDPCRCNLLIATDVAQEGLDMPKCNFVIRYNFVSNEIGSVQSKGRARAPNSECYLIVDRGSVNERREYENLEKEYLMLQALADINELPDTELHARIATERERLWLQLQQKKKKKTLTSSLLDPCRVTIHCRVCKAPLCSAADMRVRCSHYICVNEADILKKIEVKRSQCPREFRSDFQNGPTVCRGCRQKVGLEIEYKQGSRKFGYSLIKDNVMWRYDDETEYRPVKKWSAVPFPIEEEKLFPGS